MQSRFWPAWATQNTGGDLRQQAGDRPQALRERWELTLRLRVTVGANWRCFPHRLGTSWRTRIPGNERSACRSVGGGNDKRSQRKRRSAAVSNERDNASEQERCACGGGRARGAEPGDEDEVEAESDRQRDNRPERRETR